MMIERAIIWAVAFTGLLLILSTCGSADAHDAPRGWTYPLSCCSDLDCREVPDSAIGEGPEGYTIRATGETIPMSDHKVRPSPDGVFHWCSRGGRDDGATICLFVPPRGF